MDADVLPVALVTDVFHDDPDGERLRSRLTRAREEGARLAVLPELPMDPWIAAERTPNDGDAEPPDGPRQTRMGDAARAAGIQLLGGAVVRDPESGRRHNTAILWNAAGGEVGRYRKLHLPEEEGFWETAHYEPGTEAPEVWDVQGGSVGVQICSDANRPEGCHLLGALGADAILVPRATPLATWDRWRLVLRANAVTSGAYLISVNRPAREAGVDVGGPSIVVAPDGSVLLETTEPVAVVELEAGVLENARRDYPGYLPVRSELYARGWSGVTARSASPPGRSRTPPG